MLEFDAIFFIIVFGSFAAAVCNAAFAVGGAQIILAITSTVLPVTAIVPIHSTLLIGSTATRILFFWEHIDWKVVRPFLVGSLIGALLGAKIYVELPESVIAIVIGIVMLVSIWLPKPSWTPQLRHPWAIVGFLHSLFSTLFAFGAVLHAVILHTRLNRMQLSGTLAGCLTGMSIFKIIGYVYYGFDYSPYFAVIACSVAVAFAGTWLGRKVVNRISERVFRYAFRTLVTVSAIRLLYFGLT